VAVEVTVTAVAIRTEDVIITAAGVAVVTILARARIRVQDQNQRKMTERVGEREMIGLQNVTRRTGVPRDQAVTVMTAPMAVGNAILEKTHDRTPDHLIDHHPQTQRSSLYLRIVPSAMSSSVKLFVPCLDLGPDLPRSNTKAAVPW
jgi:hypothetical protein